MTQYECDNLMAPTQDCLQFLTAATGTIASFNWDTSATTVATTQYHLSSQQYDICIRRARSYCSVCYSPQIISTTTGTASSYGVSMSCTDLCCTDCRWAPAASAPPRPAPSGPSAAASLLSTPSTPTRYNGLLATWHCFSLK